MINDIEEKPGVVEEKVPGDEVSPFPVPQEPPPPLYKKLPNLTHAPKGRNNRTPALQQRHQDNFLRKQLRQTNQPLSTLKKRLNAVQYLPKAEQEQTRQFLLERIKRRQGEITYRDTLRKQRQ